MFAAWHRRAALEAATRASGAATGGSVRRMALPRPVLYDAWHLLGWPAPGGGGAPFDVVHAPSLAVPPQGRGALVVTVHDAAAVLFPEAFSARGRRFHRQGTAAAARRADRVITVSEAARQEIAAHTGIAAERIAVVPNGVDHVHVDAARRDRVVRRFGLDGGFPWVLWVGSREPRKGVGTLVAAMARLPGPTRLVLAGYQGWLGEGLVDAADRAALGERLVELGRLDEDDLWALYGAATVFALPSRHEGFGLPVLEAMSQGTPVVCSDIAALREVGGGAARLVPPGDAAAWAEALADLLADAGQRERLAVAGMARSRLFSWQETVRATHRVYQEACR